MKSEHQKLIAQVLVGIFAVFAFMVFWHICAQLIVIHVEGKVEMILPTPAAVFDLLAYSMHAPIGADTIWGHISWSLSRVLMGFLLGSLLGILLGATMGWYKTVEAIFRPLFEIIRPIPPIAWTPVAIALIGLGEEAKWFLITLASFTSTTVNTYDGVKNIEPTIIRAAKMLGANDRQLFQTIVLPAAVPYIFAGLQVGIATSWATVLAAEMLRSDEGVGWLIESARQAGSSLPYVTQILVGIVTIGVIGFLLATLMRIAEDRLCAWNKQGK